MWSEVGLDQSLVNVSSSGDPAPIIWQYPSAYLADVLIVKGLVDSGKDKRGHP
jgi:hypothetical protein